MHINNDKSIDGDLLHFSKFGSNKVNEFNKLSILDLPVFFNFFRSFFNSGFNLHSPDNLASVKYGLSRVGADPFGSGGLFEVVFDREI